MNEWISVKDRLPDNRSGVIACSGDLVGELYFDKDEFQHPYEEQIDEYQQSFISSVTDWMPLPDPPKK